MNPRTDASGPLQRVRRIERMMRCCELLVTVVGLVALAPLLSVLLLLVKLTSRGPMLFAQWRVGRGGTLFRLFKLRTMVDDAELRGPRLTGRDDPRITRIGRLLRRTKLDELPQLWNVLRGDMSLVGPRPEVPEMVERAPAEFGLLLRVRPGLVSEASLRFRHEEELLPAEDREAFYIAHILPEKLRLDLQWLERRTVLSDLELLLRASLLLLKIKRNDAPMALPGGARSRRAARLLLDGAIVVLAWWLATLLRFDGMPHGLDGVRLHVLALPLAALSMAVLALGGAGQAIWRYFAAADFGRLALLHLLVPALLTACRALLPDGLALLRAPYSVIALSYLITLFGAGAARMLWSILAAGAERRTRPRSALVGRIAVIGAGRTAVALVHALKRAAGRDAELLVCFDDDALKHDTRVCGVPVVGPLRAAPEWLARVRPDHLLIAIGALPEARLRPLVEAAHRNGVRVKIVPSLLEQALAPTPATALRDLSIEDLMGRPPVRLDPADEEIASVYRGRTILVTGAAGSIGSELVRQLARLEPRRLVLLDKDENGLFELDRELCDGPAAPVRELAVMDLRDRRGLVRLLRRTRPDVVLHAAAHKHVPLMEQNVIEAVANNVLGTSGLARLSAAAHVRAFVLISTDKAVRPSSVMGATKRVAELVVRDLAQDGARHAAGFSVVRFGNVLASRGSVVETFLRQIRRGRPITITHPDVERYFLSIPEAAELVLVAGALPEPRGSYVLDMGPARRIVDLACDLARLAGATSPPPITFVGLRPGEKLFEELSVTGRLEAVEKRDGILLDAEPGAARVEVAALLTELKRAVRRGDAVRARRALASPLVGLTDARAAGAGGSPPARGDGVHRSSDSATAFVAAHR